MSFAEIERKIGAMLPNSATAAHWWETSETDAVASIQSRAWRQAGFTAELLGGSERVRF